VKVVERTILQFQEKDFFVPIRDKASFARLVVCAARQLLLENQGETITSISKMRLVVDKMSRLFFYRGNKYFSVAFPFTVVNDGGEVAKITTYSGKILDFGNISAVISILDSDYFIRHPSLIDFPIEPKSIEELGIYFLEEIMQFEPSYIRYDNDESNQNGRLHPLNHLDINYSQYGTYKLGLRNGINVEYFEDLQNTNTDCSFVVDR